MASVITLPTDARVKAFNEGFEKTFDASRTEARKKRATEDQQRKLQAFGELFGGQISGPEFDPGMLYQAGLAAGLDPTEARNSVTTAAAQRPRVLDPEERTIYMPDGKERVVRVPGVVLGGGELSVDKWIEEKYAGWSQIKPGKNDIPTPTEPDNRRLYGAEGTEREVRVPGPVLEQGEPAIDAWIEQNFKGWSQVKPGPKEAATEDLQLDVFDPTNPDVTRKVRVPAAEVVKGQAAIDAWIGTNYPGFSPVKGEKPPTPTDPANRTLYATDNTGRERIVRVPGVVLNEGEAGIDQWIAQNFPQWSQVKPGKDDIKDPTEALNTQALTEFAATLPVGDPRKTILAGPGTAQMKIQMLNTFAREHGEEPWQQVKVYGAEPGQEVTIQVPQAMARDFAALEAHAAKLGFSARPPGATGKVEGPQTIKLYSVNTPGAEKDVRVPGPTVTAGQAAIDTWVAENYPGFTQLKTPPEQTPTVTDRNLDAVITMFGEPITVENRQRAAHYQQEIGPARQQVRTHFSKVVEGQLVTNPGMDVIRAHLAEQSLQAKIWAGLPAAQATVEAIQDARNLVAKGNIFPPELTPDGKLNPEDAIKFLYTSWGVDELGITSFLQETLGMTDAIVQAGANGAHYFTRDNKPINTAAQFVQEIIQNGAVIIKR